MEERIDYDKMQRPDNLFIWSILVVFYCGLPFGIPALVYASKAKCYWDLGKKIDAYEAAKMSRIFILIAACITAFIAIVLILIYGFLFKELLSRESFLNFK